MTATFFYDNPQWPGYVGDAKTGPRRPDPAHWPASVSIQPTLTQLVGSKVIVQTPTLGYDAGTRLRSLTYKNLDPKRAYTMKLSTANTWGTCARTDGRILLAAGK
ncbi:hypothetical protein [Actinoplanes sp. NPDC026623]|uniref:hypothetical protein n=1 Tax=Actinoplanes sp. NPDC026623 TaxID=3155610 RepID=UPI0034088872